MTTLTKIAADLAANLSASMADIQQRMAQVDTVLDELRGAGIELELRAHHCGISCYAQGKPYGSVSLTARQYPPASSVRAICAKHGGDWFISDGATLSQLYGIHVHFYGLDLAEQDTTP